MVYIFLFLFLFTGPPFSHAETRKVLDLATSYPSPFGKYQKLDTTFFRLTPLVPPIPECNKDSGYQGYIYLGTDGRQYTCDPSQGWVVYAPWLWEKIDENNVHSIYPIDIQDRDSLFSVGIGTTTPLAKLHISGNNTQEAGDRYTSIRLQHGADNNINSSSWEMRTYETYTELGPPRNRLFTIWGTRALDDVFFITDQGNFHLIDNVRELAGGGPEFDPKLNVQNQGDACGEEAGEKCKKILGDNLAATFTYNVSANDGRGVGIGFGVDIDDSDNYRQQYGAAIAHERTGPNSEGKLHFATKPAGNTQRDIPVHMTLNENGSLGLGTTSPHFQLSLKSNDDLDTGGILATAGPLGEGPSLSDLPDPLQGNLFLWSPKKASLNVGYYFNMLTDGRLGQYSVALGADNFAAGEASAVLGGHSNQIRGLRSVILGGSDNRVDSDYSLAAGGGMHLTADADQTFVWGYSADGLTVSASNAFIIATGNVGIGKTNPDKAYALDVKGKIRAEEFVTEEGVVVGPSRMKPTKDLAETFETSQEVEVGDVLVIDSKQKMKLKKSSQPYEKGVIGIVSENPAIVLRGSQIEMAGSIQKFTQGTNPPVALAGQVPCKVTNENGPIEVGDLLTSSSIPGHAMKVTDRDKAFGAIVGKALEPFSQGPSGESTGKITVFVTLQ